MADERLGAHAGDHPSARAASGWSALEDVCVRRTWRGAVVVEQGVGRDPAVLWPYSQVIHAAVILDWVEGKPGARAGPLFDALDRYRAGPAWAASVGGDERYYDDNAWVGLAAAAAGRKDLAGEIDQWLRTGEHPHGGVAWREGTATRNACSTGSAALLALRVDGNDPEAVAYAHRCRAFMTEQLGRADGLVADHIDDSTGRVEPTPWTYNQGLAIGVDVLLHRAGDVSALARAQELAATTVAHFGAGDRLWRQPPAFVAVLLRLLLLLHAVDGDPAWPAFVDDYLDRAWDQGRVARNGLFRAGGIGRYDDGLALDQAAIVQLFALRALPPDAVAALA